MPVDGRVGAGGRYIPSRYVTPRVPPPM
jgi:hypothetical protein